MALPSSGQITLNQVNVELGNSGTAQIGLGDSAVRSLFDVASGEIGMSDGYGAQSAFAFNLTSNVEAGGVGGDAINTGYSYTYTNNGTVYGSV